MKIVLSTTKIGGFNIDFSLASQIIINPISI